MNPLTFQSSDGQKNLLHILMKNLQICPNFISAELKQCNLSLSFCVSSYNEPGCFPKTDLLKFCCLFHINKQKLLRLLSTTLKSWSSPTFFPFSPVPVSTVDCLCSHNMPLNIRILLSICSFIVLWVFRHFFVWSTFSYYLEMLIISLIRFFLMAFFVYSYDFS